MRREPPVRAGKGFSRPGTPENGVLCRSTVRGNPDGNRCLLDRLNSLRLRKDFTVGLSPSRESKVSGEGRCVSTDVRPDPQGPLSLLRGCRSERFLSTSRIFRIAPFGGPYRSTTQGNTCRHTTSPVVSPRSGSFCSSRSRLPPVPILPGPPYPFVCAHH